tara:strand:+ start:70678 stop:70830 length:153 start_codon:yes stop_codon:yes gene_type:complete
MKDILGLLVGYSPAIILTTGAVLLAMNSLGGWGWFLLVAALICPTRFKIN